MSAAAEPANKTLQHALKLGAKGYPVFPCKPFSKVPATQHGLLDASVDPEQIKAWFDNKRGFNLAVRCGACPNEVNLLAVDIDPKNGGVETWTALVAEHGTPLAPRHETPSGGFHLFFDTPEAWSSVHTLGPGIDTRGEGGYVVVPPSRLTNDDGEIIVYATKREVALVENDPPAPPGWVRPPSSAAVQASRDRHPSVGDGDGVFDRVRAAWRGWEVELVPDGWVVVRRSGGEVYFSRPGKNPREGHSAVVMADGGLRVFTETRPPGGKPMQRGPGVTYSPGEYALHYRCGGDFSALGRLYPSARMSIRVAPSAVEPVAAPELWRLPVVDAEYWSASRRNKHIFQAARATLVAPDALDLVVFVLQSLLIPPNFLLPRIVGGQQPLNFLACLVARTGMFKTSTLDAARDLLGPFPPWVVQIGMGTGEGIGATFLKDEMEVNSKSGKQQKTGRLVRNDIQAAFFEADEGSKMSQVAKRQGATIIADLCKAWSGSMLGEANADPTTRRQVLDRDYRIAALVNIQPSNFEGLFSEANTGTGLTGRFMFSGTLDADIPDEDTEWPGMLECPTLAKAPVTLGIDESIVARAKAAVRRIHREGTLNASMDEVGQNAAVVSRMAGIAALMDDRRHITEDDWAVASMRVAASAACLKALSGWSQSLESDAGHKRDSARARSAARVESEHERIKTGQATDRILTVLALGPMSAGNLTAKLPKSCRDFRDDALDALVSLGKVKLVGERWELL